MGHDTAVAPNTWWLGQEKLEPEDGDLTTLVQETIREHLEAEGMLRVQHDNGATEMRVEVTVKLVPVGTCGHCAGTGTIGVVVRLGGAGEEEVRCPKCNGEGRY